MLAPQQPRLPAALRLVRWRSLARLATCWPPRCSWAIQPEGPHLAVVLLVAIAWEIPQVGPEERNYSGVLATAGGVVFYEETSGGSAARHFPVAKGHLGSKRQPAGTMSGLGT